MGDLMINADNRRDKDMARATAEHLCPLVRRLAYERRILDHICQSRYLLTKIVEHSYKEGVTTVLAAPLNIWFSIAISVTSVAYRVSCVMMFRASVTDLRYRKMGQMREGCRMLGKLHLHEPETTYPVFKKHEVPVRDGIVDSESMTESSYLYDKNDYLLAAVRSLKTDLGKGELHRIQDEFMILDDETQPLSIETRERR